MKRIFIFLLTILCSSCTKALEAILVRSLTSSCVADVDRQIINGRDTTKTYPWMLSYQREVRTGFSHICGATLISPNWALTAAHCVRSNDRSPFVHLEANMRTFGQGTILRVKRVIVHPSYISQSKPFKSMNDIALIELENTTNIEPVLLDLSNVSAELMTDFNEYTIMGWGRTGSGIYIDSRDILQVTEMDAINQNACLLLFGASWSANGTFDPTTQICFLNCQRDTGSCQGDSGGSAIVKLKDGTYMQVGLSSYRDEDCAPNLPSVYTNVDSYLNWIRIHVNDLPQYTSSSNLDLNPENCSSLKNEADLNPYCP